MIEKIAELDRNLVKLDRNLVEQRAMDKRLFSQLDHTDYLLRMLELGLRRIVPSLFEAR
jgi:hypothetical protein